MNNKSLKLLFILELLLFFSVPSSLIAQKSPWQLEHIWASDTLQPKGVAMFSGLSDGKHYVKLEKNAIQVYDYKNGKNTRTLLSGDDIKYEGKPIQIRSFVFNHNESKVLLFTEMKRIYRHSVLAKVLLYDVVSKNTEAIFGDAMVRYPTFSPKGEKIAAVLDNNIVVYDMVSKEITTIGGDGKEGEIIYGAVDWVYEEEFSMNRGYEWSPSGQHIAYYKFDETRVKPFDISYYRGLNYPITETYKYPKAGEDNSIVSVFTYDFTNHQSRLIETTAQDDSYLPRIQWGSAQLLYIQKLNRHQNHYCIWQVQVSLQKKELVWEEKNKHYVDINDQLWFESTGTVFLLTSEIDGWNRIYLMDTKNKKSMACSQEKADVDHICHYNPKDHIIYYTVADEHPSERQLYSFHIPKATFRKLSTHKGWNAAYFTQGGLYYMNVYSHFNAPPVYHLCDNKGQIIRVLENNQKLVNTLENFERGATSFGEWQTSYGVSLHYWQILPPQFDPSKTYPILFFVYGGPGSQTVKNQWGGGNYLWHQLLASKGYIVVSVDNRGTGFRGQRFKKETYLQLGKLEIEDQIAAAEYFGSLDYVDKQRIGIWGWSYGGFMSSLGITRGAHVFKTAIAVAPVTHWKYYDNIYTERYMRTPAENPEGYNDHAPLTLAGNIKGHYLLIHGMADDNVHLQHAAEMINEMVQKDIAFDSEFYPNKNHGIGGGNTRLHLYKKMTRFILEKL
jgi:dipeptidyl-peptidase-4